MDLQLLLSELVNKDLKRLMKTKTEMEQQLKQLPKGSLTVRNGKYYHLYRENGKQHMVLIKDPALLNSLRIRKQLTASLPLIKMRIENCSSYLENDVIYDTKEKELELPEHYRGGRCPALWLPGDMDPVAWANADYPSNPAEMKNPSDTAGGRKVRSKSEAIIGSQAEARHLLHRYEQEIVIFGEKFYPDFIFLLPNCRRLIYYEHFGKMDDEDYVKKVMHKLEMYPYYGLYLGYNFFASFETKSMPFSFNGAKRNLDRILSMDRCA